METFSALLAWICAWISGWVNNREAGDLRRHCAHYDVTVITSTTFLGCLQRMMSKLLCHLGNTSYFAQLCRSLAAIWSHGEQSKADWIQEKTGVCNMIKRLRSICDRWWNVNIKAWMKTLVLGYELRGFRNQADYQITTQYSVKERAAASALPEVRINIRNDNIKSINSIRWKGKTDTNFRQVRKDTKLILQSPFLTPNNELQLSGVHVWKTGSYSRRTISLIQL